MIERNASPKLLVRTAVAAVVAGVVSSAVVGSAMAGAWTREAKTGVVITTGSFSYGDRAFDDDGKPVPVPEYRKFELTNHLEYGITPWLTGVLRAELRSAVENAVLDESAAAGALGARVRLIKAPKWVFSAELTALSGDFDTIGVNEDPDAAGVDSRLLFGYGTSVWRMPAYTDVQAAYRYRSGSSANEVRVDLTIGIKPWERWEFMAQAFNTLSVQDSGGPGEPDGFRYHKLQLSALRQISERTFVQFGGFGVVAGTNALQEYGALVSFWYEF